MQRHSGWRCRTEQALSPVHMRNLPGNAHASLLPTHMSSECQFFSRCHCDTFGIRSAGRGMDMPMRVCDTRPSTANSFQCPTWQQKIKNVRGRSANSKVPHSPNPSPRAGAGGTQTMAAPLLRTCLLPSWPATPKFFWSLKIGFGSLLLGGCTQHVAKWRFAGAGRECCSETSIAQSKSRKPWMGKAACTVPGSGNAVPVPLQIWPSLGHRGHRSSLKGTPRQRCRAPAC